MSRWEHQLLVSMQQEMGLFRLLNRHLVSMRMMELYFGSYIHHFGRIGVQLCWMVLEQQLKHRLEHQLVSMILQGQQFGIVVQRFGIVEQRFGIVEQQSGIVEQRSESSIVVQQLCWMVLEPQLRHKWGHQLVSMILQDQQFGIVVQRFGIVVQRSGIAEQQFGIVEQLLVGIVEQLFGIVEQQLESSIVVEHQLLVSMQQELGLFRLLNRHLVSMRMMVSYSGSYIHRFGRIGVQLCWMVLDPQLKHKWEHLLVSMILQGQQFGIVVQRFGIVVQQFGIAEQLLVGIVGQLFGIVEQLFVGIVEQLLVGIVGQRFGIVEQQMFDMLEQQRVGMQVRLMSRLAVL
jgi:hypothetical protein